MGLDIVFGIIEAIWLNWNSENPWKKHSVQLFGGLIVFTVGYELWNQGINWVDSDRDMTENQSATYVRSGPYEPSEPYRPSGCKPAR